MRVMGRSVGIKQIALAGLVKRLDRNNNVVRHDVLTLADNQYGLEGQR